MFHTGELTWVCMHVQDQCKRGPLTLWLMDTMPVLSENPLDAGRSPVLPA